MRSGTTQNVARYGLLVALALIFSYVEAMIPPLAAVPGMKPGLTNIVVLVALYNIDEKSALIINLVRILLVSVLFGSSVSLIFSLSGGLLSGLVMILLKRSGAFSMIAVSIAGGVSHNVGQILAAMVMLDTLAVGYYLLILWFTGMAAGCLIGFIGWGVSLRVGRFLRTELRQ